MVHLQLTFKALKQGKCISGSTSKACQYLVVIKAAHFTCIAFHHGIA
ncbi:Uncharacterised protein [Vibrio cholerae]|nr:Uncharacterised protein [Vibrio cholerae]